SRPTYDSGEEIAMSSAGVSQLELLTGGETANDHFKRSFGSWFWGSTILATILHFVVFAFWPEMEAKGSYGTYTEEFIMVDIPPDVNVPPAPPSIPRPATPVISTAAIPEEITIAP